LLLLILGLAAAAFPAEEPTNEVAIVYTAVDEDGPAEKAAEYRDTDDSPGATVKLALPTGSRGLMLFAGHANTLDDKAFRLDWWMDDHLSVTLDHNEFVHNLGHDPMTNLFAVSDVKVTQATDTDPGKEHRIRNTENSLKLDYAVHGYENLKFFVHYRDQGRKGNHQTLVVGHCDTCHIVGYTQQMDQTTEDLTAGASWTAGRWTLKASHLDRSFENDAPTLYHTYDDARHPANRQYLFNDRIQYDLTDGPVPVAVTPESEKTEDRIELGYAWDGGDLAAGWSSATVTNTDLDLAYDFDALQAGVVQKVGDRSSLRIKARSYSIDNDDVFIDTVEPVAVAGPYAGQTYRQKYAYDPDWTRTSALNRDVLEGVAEFQHRFSATSTLKAGVRYAATEREVCGSCHAAPGGDDKPAGHPEVPDETTEGTLYAQMSWRRPGGWRVFAEAEYSDISTPFMNVDGGCNPDMDSTPAASPMAPTSIQYWQIHDAREYDLSNQPSSAWHLKAGASRDLSPSVQASGYLKYQERENTDLDHSDWSGKDLSANVYLGWMPSERWNWFLGYNYLWNDTQTHLCVPVMDG
jgi:hypothetical protein